MLKEELEKLKALNAEEKNEEKIIINTLYHIKFK